MNYYWMHVSVVSVYSALLQLSFVFCSRQTTNKSTAPSYKETTAAE